MRIFCCIFLFCAVAHAAPCPASVKDEAALMQMEQSWARALEQQDVRTLDCLLADDFEDANPVGTLSDRSKILAAAQKPGSHHKLSEMRARVYGDVGYVRGLATALTPDGKPKVMVRFTDVYVYRDGRWQCVAAHESQIPMERP